MLVRSGSKADVLTARDMILVTWLISAAMAGCWRLQIPHPESTPSQTLAALASAAPPTWDVYGDFDEQSYLRDFEAALAKELGCEDAVFLPSGVMAQSIALLIHSSATQRKTFACHSTSHLLLHEQEGFRELLGMEALVVPRRNVMRDGFPAGVPLTMHDVRDTLEAASIPPGREVSTLILEHPHREIGGKLTSWEDLQAISAYCRSHNIRFHLDGARLFEASASSGRSLAEVASLFDSIYVSFYKGLGGMAAAALLGSSGFCAQARVWLRRFGGNLFTLLPYVVSAQEGYKRHWLLESSAAMTFRDKYEKMKKLVKTLSADSEISSVVTFDPTVPETNMVHGYFRHKKDTVLDAVRCVSEETGIEVLSRVRDVAPDQPIAAAGYCSMFEWSIGEGNGVLEDSVFVEGWKKLSGKLLSSDI